MFLKNVLTYVSANSYSQVIRAGQEVALRIILPPELLGAWNLVAVTTGFANTFDLGVLGAANRKIALLYGEGREERSSTYRGGAFFLHVGQKALLALGVIIYTLLSMHRYTTLETAASFVAAGALLCSALGELGISFHQSAQRYRALSKALAQYYTVAAVLIVACTYFLGVPGLFFAAIASLLIQAGIVRLSMLREKLELTWRWRWSDAKSLLKFAIPFRIVDYPINLLDMLDVLFIAKFLGLEALAIYSTAKLIFVHSSLFPRWVTNVIIMRLTTLSGAKRDRRVLADEMRLVLLSHILIFIPFAICGVNVAARVIIPILMPSYVESIEVLVVLLYGLYFIASVNGLRNFWMIDRAFVKIGLSNLLPLFIMGAALIYVAKGGNPGLKDLAIVYLAGNIAHFLYIIFALGLPLWGVRHTMEMLLYLALSAALTTYAVYMGGAFDPGIQAQSTGDAALDLIKSEAIVLPLIIYGVWRIKLIAYVKSRLIVGPSIK